MADQEVTVPLEVDDSELFSGAVQDTAPEPVNEPDEPQERSRDEKGRFVAKEEEAPPEPVAVPEQQPEPQEKAEIPSWRLREMREERDAARQAVEQERQRAWHLEQQFNNLQAQLQQNAPQPDPVNIFEDPDKALQQRFQPFEQRLNTTVQSLTLRASRAEAVAEFGKQSVSEMEKFIEQQSVAGNPKLQLLAAQMKQSDHPVGVAMEWYQGEKLVRDTGGDLNAYKNKILEEAMQDPSFQSKVLEAARGQAQQQTQTRPNIQLPPSLNKVGSANVAAADDYDQSDAGIFNYAMARR